MSGNQQKGRTPGAEAAFWERYARALEKVGVPEKRRHWYQRDCERFISWLQPARLRQAQAPQIIEYLLYLEGTGLESWQLKQSSEALRILYQAVLEVPWSKDWPELLRKRHRTVNRLKGD